MSRSPYKPNPQKWRVGRKVGRTIYRQEGDQPSDSDPLIGMMDTRELAEEVVDAVNRLEDANALIRSFAALYGDPVAPNG